MARGPKRSVSQPEFSSQQFVVSLLEYALHRVLTMNIHLKIGFYLLLVTSMSVLGDLARPGPSYFSDKGNLFNIYFVKLGWGWTSALVISFILISNQIENDGQFKNLGRPLARYAVLTVYWYVCTHSFEWLENITGSCSHSDFPRKRPCLKGGHGWLGFDISGHCFLLVHSLLFMNSELQIIFRVSKKLESLGKSDSSSSSGEGNYTLPIGTYRLALRALTVIMFLLQCIWELMLLTTALYFHTTVQKLVGVFFAVGGWFFLPFRPTEPSKRNSR